MHLLWLVLTVGCDTPDALPSDTFAWNQRGVADTAHLPLDPHAPDNCPTDDDKLQPGLCGCDYRDVDVDDDGAADSCIADSATVLGVIGIETNVKDDAQVDIGAVVGDRVSIENRVIVATRAVVDNDSTIGDDTVLGRRSEIGEDCLIGPESLLGRSVQVGDNAHAQDGELNVGYGSVIGDRFTVQGSGMTTGSLVTIGDDVTVGRNVIIARGVTIEGPAALGDGVVVGPDSTIAAGAVLDDGVRLRKNVQVGINAHVGRGVRIGRDSQLGANSHVGDDARLDAGVIVGAGAEVPDDAHIARGTQITVVDPIGDTPPVLDITSPLPGADATSGAVVLTGTISDDVGLSRVAYRVDDGPILPVTVSNGSFSQTINVAIGANTITILAEDIVGQTEVVSVTIDSCANEAGFDTVWVGGTDLNWSTATNWTNGTPSATDNVLICANAVQQPRMNGATTIGGLTMSSTATLNMRGATLTVNGDVNAGFLHDGEVVMQGTGTLRGVVDELTVAGRVTVSGATEATHNVAIVPGGALAVDGQSLLVQGTFTQTIAPPDEGLAMANGAEVSLRSRAEFNGDAAMDGDQLNGGVLRLGGDLRVPTAANGSLRVGATRMVFDGTSPQSLAIPVGDLQTSWLGDVTVADGNAAVRCANQELA